MRNALKRNASQAIAYGMTAFVFIVACLSSLVSVAFAERIKDIANFEGVRENQLIGYGLAVGLDGTGDSGDATLQSIANLLKKMGVTVIPDDIKAENTAAVMVTAVLPAFPKPGTKIDVLVSTLADAESLQGGTLLLTPLRGPDGNVYAAAQGPISIGGFGGGSGGSRVQKNHPTAGKVPEGAIIEMEPAFRLGNGGDLRLFLNRPDFTTSALTAKKINDALSGTYAQAIDPSTVRLQIPPDFLARPVELVALVEGLDVSVDAPARVVINERTGTIVIGDTVKISPVAIAHGALTIEIRTDYRISQPSSFAPESARTVVVPQQNVAVKEQQASLVEVSGVTLGEIARALNALGVTPRDLIAIMQALKSAGALRAQIEII